MSRTGIAFCAVYVLLTIASVAWGLSVDDPKGRFVLLPLPLAFKSAGLHEIGVLPYLEGLSWTAAYLLLVPPTLVVLYFAGALVGKLVNSLIGTLVSSNRTVETDARKSGARGSL